MTSLRGSAVLVGAGLLLFACMVVALGRGPAEIPVDRVVDVIARRFGLWDDAVTPPEDQIVWQLRMPRVLAAASCGVVLALAGAVLQSITRNDLADPYLLGLASGATVGAVAVIVLGVSVAGVVGSAAISLAAFVGSLAALLGVLALAVGRGGAIDPARTVLAGVAVGAGCSAIASYLVMVEGDSHAARRVLRWTLGSIAGAREDDVPLLVALAVVSVVGTLLVASSLDAFAFGEVSARSLGVDVTRLRWTLLVGTALAVSVVVANVGAIGFVGLVVPHVARMLVGPGHVLLLPLSALLGATLLVVADTGARTWIDGLEVPVGVITAAVGAPFFAWLLHRARRKAAA